MVAQLLESWSSIYSNHAALRTAVEFTHIGGLVAGGGGAITADLATITAARQHESPVRASQLEVLKRTHRIVLGGLVALFASGLLLFAADLETYLYSRIFWIKMGLIVLLLVNGSVLLRMERRAARGEPGAWARLHVAAMISLAVWAVTTLAGAALPNIG
jgi:uncharacterized membrane protein